MAQLEADNTNKIDHDALQEKISNVMKTLIQDELMQCCQEYKAKEALLDEKILELDQTKSECLDVLQDSKQAHTDLLAQNDTVAKKIQYFTRSVDGFEKQLQKLKSNASELTEDILKQTDERTKRIYTDQLSGTTFDMDRMNKFQRTHDTILRKLNWLKDGTKTLFQQTEDDYDLMSKRILHVERDIHTIQGNLRNPVSQVPQTPKRRHLLSDSDDSHKQKFCCSFCYTTTYLIHISKVI